MTKLDRAKVYTRDALTFEYWGKGGKYQWRVCLGGMHFAYVSENDVARVLEVQGV